MERDVDRHVLPLLREALGDLRVVVLGGARQSGKTTLLRRVHAEVGGTFLSFDEPDVLRAAIDDPAGLIAGFPAPLMVDEVQRAGDPFLLALKAAVDRDRRPGRAVLSGSTRFLTVPTLSESLAGRAVVLELWPFSQGERDGHRERFLDRAFLHPERLAADAQPVLRAELFARVVGGGFPEAVRFASPRSRRLWFDSYVTTVLQRDVREIGDVRRGAELDRLLRLVAARDAGELVVAGLARSAGLDEATTATYLRLLETVYLISRVPAWSRNLTAKIARRPKVVVNDSGLAAFLVGADEAALLRPTSAAAGPLLEAFVVAELLRQRTWSDVDVTVSHVRDRDGHEVDIVVETRDGRVVGIECKAAATVREADLGGLRWLRDRVGDDFVAGLVLHAGERALPFGDRLWSLPVSSLWTA